jgi:endonuclease YncB( thermonuclease family)
MNTITEELLNAANKVEKFSLENEYKKALVIDVYDGDTITVVFKHFDKINSWKVRLLGINSPEIRPSRSLSNREDVILSAKKSRDYLSELILNKIIYIHCGKFDSFGRILAYIYLNKEDLLNTNFTNSVNKKMLLGGYAVEY